MTILARRLDDELLLLASDGLWDVLSNQEACTLAKRCLRRARQRGASRQSAARIAATVRAALLCSKLYVISTDPILRSQIGHGAWAI